VTLSAEGILSALTVAGAALVTDSTDQSTAIDFPWGLITSVMDHDGSDVTAIANPRPIVSAGVAGLWNMRFRGEDTTPADARLRLIPLRPDTNEPGQDLATLAATDRQRIVSEANENVIFPELKLFELSALGGSISANAKWPSFEWEHHTTLGRDQKVTVISRGFLFPFGHRAEFQVLTERLIRPRLGDELANAGLHTQTILTVTEPVRGAVTGFARLARQFPFSQVEILTRTFSNVGKAEVRNHQRRALRLDQLRTELATSINDLNAAQDQVNTILRDTPPDGDLSAAAAAGVPEAQELLDLRSSNAGLAAEIDSTQAEIDDDSARIFDLQSRIDQLQQSATGADGSTDPDVQQQINDLNQQIADIRAKMPSGIGLPALRQQLAASQAQADLMEARVRNFLHNLPRTEQALFQAGDPSAVALFTLRDQVAQQRANIARIEAISSQFLEVSFMPQMGSGPLRFPVRCSGSEGDVHFDIPMIFIHDLAFSEDDDFEGFVSLTDGDVKSDLDTTFAPHGQIPLAGVAIDMLRAENPQSGDVHEVSEISIGGNTFNAAFWPILSQFKIALPALRSLLPGHDAPLAFRYSPDFINQGDAADVAMTLVDAAHSIGIDFGDHPEKSGGLITPIFAADALSRKLGPVPKAAMPGANGDLASIFRDTTMLGMSLGSLINTAGLSSSPDPPRITPILDDGTPVGVLMEWKPPLKNNGPFVGNPAATLDLTVQKSPSDTSTECTITNFSLVLPGTGDPLVRLNFESLKFTQKPGQAPYLQVSGPTIEFLAGLKLLKELLDKLKPVLAAGPAIRATSSGLTASYAVAVPNVTAGTFLLRNIAMLVSIEIPFSRDPVVLSLSFASRDNPFNLSVLMFGGGGYIEVKIGPTGLTGLEASMEFGAAVAVDFVVARGEVHALGGAHFVASGEGVALEAYIRIGGSVEVLGLVSVSVELRVELIYVDANGLNRLAGRAKLVIEVDVLLFSDSVELDSGEWVLPGNEAAPMLHSAQPLALTDAPDPALAHWQDYQKAFAA
jgi:hypothetical protein